MQHDPAAPQPLQQCMAAIQQLQADLRELQDDRRRSAQQLHAVRVELQAERRQRLEMQAELCRRDLAEQARRRAHQADVMLLMDRVEVGGALAFGGVRQMLAAVAECVATGY